MNPFGLLQRALGERDLQKMISSTYFRLRLGMAGFAFGLPIYLMFAGRSLWDVPIQKSLSAYYHAEGGELRDEFVGVLCAVGVFLLLYRGFSGREHWALNVAGASVVGVALIPMGWRCGDECGALPVVHGILAATFFLCVGYVALRRSGDTLTKELIESDRKREFYQYGYWLLSAGMVVLIAAATVLTLVWRPSWIILSLEIAGVWSFGSYWLVKTLEVRESDADRTVSI